jgi:hypothetical protein
VTASAAARSRAKFLRDIGLYNAVRKRLFLCCIAMLPVGHSPSSQHHIVVASWPKVTAATTVNGSDCALTGGVRRTTENPRRVWFHRCAQGYRRRRQRGSHSPIRLRIGSRAACFSRASQRPKMRFATKKRVNALKLNGFASDVAPTHRGGRAGARANHPYTLRWERPDAERQPNLSAVRSSLGNIATVSRGASPR